MGANAQTAVPAFTAGQVLTAAQQTQINTGIPVFATTTTRDAAFGGTGEKTLAEGQFAYLESTNATQYYDGSTWQPVASSGTKIGQVVSTNLATTFSTTSTSYTDITGLSVTITPTLASSKVLVLVNLSVSADTNVALNVRQMRDSTAINVGTAAGSRTQSSGFLQNPGGVFAYPIAWNFLDSPNTTSATVYKVQIVVNSSTGYVNRTQQDEDAATRPRLASNITVMEVLV